MGASGKWLKSFISLKKPSANDQEKVVDKSKKKWRLWRSSSEGFGTSMKSMNKGHGAVSEKSDSSFLLDDAFTAAMATVVRAPPKGFMVIKQEWAAIRIQALFRGFLARRASRALRAVVRLQAIFRGRQVRKQAAVTLRCMQALVRVQARVKARNVRMSPLGKAVHQTGTIKQAEQGWCDIPGSADEVKAKLQMRQEAAIKRERAMAYSLSTQQPRASASPNSRSTKAGSPLEHRSLDCRSLLERWMAAKPWENRSLPDMTPLSSRKDEDLVLPSQTYKEHSLIKARRNAVTTRIAAKPLTTSQSTPSSSSAMSSECMYDDSPVSASRTSGSPPSVPYTNTLVGETTEEKEVDKPSYTNFTESTKAKQRACRRSSPNSKRLLMEDCLSRSTTSAFLNGDTRSSSGSDPSINFWRDLYGTPQRTSYQRRYYTRR